MTHHADSTLQEQGREPASIEPRETLRLALDAARRELLAEAASIPAGERSTRAVCGAWTLKDLLGQIADWEGIGVEGLRLMAVGQAPTVEHIEDIEAWNQAHAQVRKDEPWEAVWADLQTARRELLQVLAGMNAHELGQSFPFPWGAEGTAYDWVSVLVRHDEKHAQDLQTAVAPARGAEA
jgi:hypothetical protein